MRKQQNGTHDMPAEELVAIDTEFFQHTGKLHRPGGKFACLTVAQEGRYRKDSLFVDRANAGALLTKLATGNHTIALQNAEYDIRQLRNIGLWPSEWKPKIWDTMLVDQALFGGWYQQTSLSDLARRWLQRYLDKDTVSLFIERDTMNPAMRKYALEDARITRAVAEAQVTYVQNELDDDFSWYWDIDLPAMWAVLDMPPIRIDVDGWLTHGRKLYEEGISIQNSLGFNVKSNPQVKKALRKTGIRPRKSVDANALEGFLEKAQLKGNKKQIDLLRSIMRARKCRDAMSKYGEKWIEKNVEDGEWVYPSWSVTGAETGRMSCSKPNMQNIPKRGDGSIYRSFFQASKGGRLLVGDVQQQEPRFSAFLSQDPVLTEEILNDVDLHQRAAELFSITGRDARARGKTINLGLNYGMSARGLAARVGISLEEAEAGLRARRRHYQRYYAWQDRQVRSAKRRSHVQTVTGRPVWVNRYSFQHDRNAINGPVQGSAADHTKLALAYAHAETRARGIPFAINMVVHDEIVCDVPRGMMKTYRKILNDAWKEAGHKLMPTIPTEVDMASGTTWRVHE